MKIKPSFLIPLLAILAYLQMPISAESIIKKFDDGKIKLKYSTDKKGQKTGLYQEYYQNGKLKIKASYKKGQLNGKYAEYNETGKLKVDFRYKNGLRHGPQKEYLNGKISSSEIWLHNVLAFPRTTREIKKQLALIQRVNVPLVGTWPTDQLDESMLSKGIIKDNQLAIKKLMEYRYLSNVPYKHLKINKKYVANGIVAVKLLNLVGSLSHTPKNPGMPEKEYKFGYEGTSHSNLAMGSIAGSGVKQVNAYMDDSDKSNISRVGHRRWCINPAMGASGFASNSKFGAMWSFDKSNSDIPDYDYVAYPNPGYYPRSHFSNKHAWSVSLNPKKYQDAKKSNVKISVFKMNKQYQKSKVAMSLDHFSISNTGMGIRSCIIFLPQKVSTAPRSHYFVEIAGLTLKNGSKTKIQYIVEFY